LFHHDRWAGAFFAVSGENADAVFLTLKTLAQPLRSVYGAFSGHGASLRLEKILRESADVTESCSESGSESGSLSGSLSETQSFAFEYAIRFICLLVEKNCLKYIDLLLEKIEQILDEQKGILNITVESAVSPDSGFEEELARMIKQKTAAAGIKIKSHVRHELLGGYLLRIGDFYVDASLKGQLENMRAELITAVEKMPDGGNNGE
jgi:F0F1-type ATP synthase delta subunit